MKFIKRLYMYNSCWPDYCFLSVPVFVWILLCKCYILFCRKSPGSAVPPEMPGSWEEDMDYVFGLQGQSQVLGSLWLQHCVRGTSPSDRVLSLLFLKSYMWSYREDCMVGKINLLMIGHIFKKVEYDLHLWYLLMNELKKLYNRLMEMLICRNHLQRNLKYV